VLYFKYIPDGGQVVLTMATEQNEQSPQPTITQVDSVLAEQILLQSMQQLSASRRNKRGRFDDIKENENLYHGVIAKTIRNPFNECFPFMAGFIDHHKANIDDDSMLSFTHKAEADLKRAQKIQGMYDRISNSPASNDSWSIKHRYAKTNALFSGRAIYKYFAESDPEYRSFLKTVSHWDFHNEPRGGGILENHLFCGEDSVFKTVEELTSGTQYEQTQVARLAEFAKNNGYKDNTDYEMDRNNRAKALGQDPESNNYVGQGVVKLVDWYTTYNGKRYYMLFNEAASIWVRCQPLVELFPDNLYPYISWATNEDPDVFWSKAPADDARPIAKIINTMINQELYNRQKRNYGQRMYDVEMFPNVAALADWRPDGLIPVDTKNGSRPLSSGIYEVKVGDLNGTLDLVSWLDNFTGKQTGNTSSAMGESPASKQATVFMGEIQQTDKLIGVKNKSFYDALSMLGLHFKYGLDFNLTTEESVEIMGGKGIEWTKLTHEDLKTESPLLIQPTGGSGAAQLKRAEEQEKLKSLTQTQSVNPQWKDRQILLLSGFTEADVKDAFSTDSFAEKDLLSEAAQAEKDIIEGKKPSLNRGATEAYMQHLIDFAVNADNLPLDKYEEIMKFAESHASIAAQNMQRSVKEMIARRAKLALSTPGLQAPPAPSATIPEYGTNGGAPDQTVPAPGIVPGQ